MKNLKKVIAVRHGEYDDNTRSLNELGKRQVKALAEAIQPVVGDDKILLLTSPTKRATETAEILGSCLGGVSPIVCRVLSKDEYHHGISAKDEIVKAIEDHEVVIVVTHFEAPSGVVHAFSRELFQVAVPSQVVKKGHGIVFCAVSGAITCIP